MKISVCLIVKNEASNIEVCLRAVKPFANEIVIVDTGSEDRTVELASMYTDKIYNFEWCDDFSAARNYSLEKASNDWVLVLDADEIIVEFNKGYIETIFERNEQLIGRIKIINVYDDKLGTKKYFDSINRFFNKKYYHYDGKIHEQIVAINGLEYKTSKVDITVNHIGYTKEVINRTNKIERNLTLLKKSIEEKADDPYLYYQLGKTYFLGKKYDKAYKAFNKALGFPLDSRLEYVEDLIETYGYSLINDEKFNKALEIEMYKSIFEESPDYSFLLGLIYMNNGNFEYALSSFSKCIGRKEGKIEGINSYLPKYNIGVIYECLGYLEDALKYYESCKDYSPAKDRVNALKKNI